MMRVRRRTQTRVNPAMGIVVTLVASAVLTVGTTAAAQEPKLPVPPSWIGLWKRGPEPPGYKAQNPYGPRSNDYYDRLLQPWALEKRLKTRVDDDPGSICRPEGPFRTIHVSDFALLATPGKIVIVSAQLEESGYRRIYFDSPHPPNLTPTWNGDSRARWEGDTLVIDTIGLNDKSWVNSGGQPHTEAIHLVERMRLILGGEYLEVTGTVNDPKAFKEPAFYSRYYKKDNANALREHFCNEDTDSYWWRHYKARQSAEKRSESRR